MRAHAEHGTTREAAAQAQQANQRRPDRGAEDAGDGHEAGGDAGDATDLLRGDHGEGRGHGARKEAQLHGRREVQQMCHRGRDGDGQHAARQHPGPWALIELHNGDAAHGGQPTSYVAGTDNFYTVTRYNWSSYYAMAVIELGQAIEHTMKGQPVPPTLAAPMR